MHEIVIIPNFLSSAECQELITLGKAQKTNSTGIQNDLVPEWKSVSNFEFEGGNLEQRIADVHERVSEEIKARYEVTDAVPREDGYFYEYTMGDFYRPHCDAQSVTVQDGIAVGARKPSSADVSSIVYLNDNFVGGQLDFGFRGQTVKPQEGMLVLFYGGWQNSHCVLPIELGKRYCIVNWFVTQPYLVPVAEVIPEPYSKSFEMWQEEYSKVR